MAITNVNILKRASKSLNEIIEFRNANNLGTQLFLFEKHNIHYAFSAEKENLTAATCVPKVVLNPSPPPKKIVIWTC